MLFGHPNSRERSWRICYRKKNKVWTCQFSLAEIAKKMLSTRTREKCILDYTCYLIESDGALGVQKESELSSCHVCEFIQLSLDLGFYIWESIFMSLVNLHFYVLVTI